MISFVYFDVGGVAIKDFSGSDKWTELKKELGVTPENDAEFEDFWLSYESERCLGPNVDTLLPLIKKRFGSKFSDNYSLLIDGFVNRFEVNKSIWPVIKKIHQKCKVGLLTNMYPGMYEAILDRGLLPDIDWDAVIDSSVVKLQKPDKKIYELAERLANFNGHEILFVENSRTHIKKAEEFGWQCILYDSKNYEESSVRLEEELREIPAGGPGTYKKQALRRG